MSNFIHVHAENGVVTVSLNRLERKNSITSAMYGAMADALDSASTDPDARVVVIQGHESVFSAGNDIGEFLSSTDAGSSSHAHRFLQSVVTFPKPLIAAVCGPAIGLAATVLFHCDLVYAGDNAVFSMPFVNLGLCPEAASTLLVPQMLGHHRAAEALLLAEPIPANAALQMGLVNRVVPRAEVNALAQAVAQRLGAKPTIALIETKRLMKAGQQTFVSSQIAAENAAFARLLKGAAAKEAFSAFLEKRKPVFTHV